MIAALWIIAYVVGAVAFFRWFIRWTVREYPGVALDGGDIAHGAFFALVWPVAWPVAWLMDDTRPRHDYERLERWARVKR